MIDTYFKSYFWTFHLLVLAGAAFLVARTVNAYVGQALSPSAESVATASPRAKAGAEHPVEQPSVPLSAFLDRNVFHAAREDLKAAAREETEAKSETQAAAFDPNRCERSSMAAGLIATLVTKNPGESFAVFDDRNKKQPVPLRIGEKVLDEAEIMAIEWRRVLVRHGGRCEVFSLEEEDASRPATSPVAVTAPFEAGDSASGEMEFGKNIKKMSEKDYEIPRQEVENVLSNLNNLATQARIMPNFENGKANGFKLIAIRPGSLYSKIGIQNGDVVQRINGHEMNSPDKALEIYSKLKDAQAITVDISRGGKTQTLSYQIR